MPQFISALLEDFADEWANKWMMHYRWYKSSKEGGSTPPPDAALYARRMAIEVVYYSCAVVVDCRCV